MVKHTHELNYFLKTGMLIYIFIYDTRYTDESVHCTHAALIDTCCHSIYVTGYDEEKSLLMSQKGLEKRFGQSAVFIAATFMEQGGIPPTTNPATLLKEAIHVISCGYEDKSEWGKEVVEIVNSYVITWTYSKSFKHILSSYKFNL